MFLPLLLIKTWKNQNSFYKTKDNLIPIISTNIILSDIEIINTYKNGGI